MYLSTTDFIQHKYGPTEKGALDFYAMFDSYVSKLDSLGVTLIVTADHGMNDKHLSNGEPDVVYLQDELDRTFGEGKTKVILPITDPYVVHHGALGSYAVVYCADPAPQIAKLKAMAGIEAVLTKDEAAGRFELPPERLGDIVVVSTKHKVLGTSAARHDLSGLTEPLRSHGGISEQRVPLLCHRKLANPDTGSHRWRNFDAFDLALNLVA